MKKTAFHYRESSIVYFCRTELYSYYFNFKFKHCITQRYYNKDMRRSPLCSNRPDPPSLIAVFWPFFYILLTTIFIYLKKTEVQTVKLKCWTGLNLNWFRSYDTKCKNIFSDLANSRNVNGRFLTISSQFSAIYIIIFHKTEVQAVILRCWTGLNHNWFKVMTQNANQAVTTRRQSSHIFIVVSLCMPEDMVSVWSTWDI